MRALVIGDSCIDIFRYGRCLRLSPEAPVPVFNPTSSVENFGMAGNVSENLKSLGVEVDLVTNKEKITKTRLVDEKSNQMIVRVDENDSVSSELNVSGIDFSIYDAAVVADYDKGFLSFENIYEISRKHKLTFLDTKKVLNQKYASGYSFIKINETEYEKSKETITEAFKSKLIVTLGERGCVYDGVTYPAEETHSVKDISGAGDTFLAALVFKFLETKNIFDSIVFANRCAGDVVTKRGVSVIKN